MTTIHKIDRLELLANISELGREAHALIEDTTVAAHSAKLRRMIVILAYMREHLEMVGCPVNGADARAQGRDSNRLADVTPGRTA